jgi:hypothetical protein
MFPPAWRGQDIVIIADWHVRSGTATGTVTWQYEIEYRESDQGNWASLTADVGPSTKDVVIGTANPDSPYITLLGTISWTGNANDGMFYLRITRKGTTDSYGNLAYLNELIIGPASEISDVAA